MASDELIRRFIRALAAGDEVSARQLCTERSWRAQRNSMFQLFRQLCGHGRHSTLRMDGMPRVSESARGALDCWVVDPDGEPLSTLTLIYDHIPARLTGWTRSRVLVERYLAGTVPADIGLHTLVNDSSASDAARGLAEELSRVGTRDEAALERLLASVGTVGSDAKVLGYLLMRIASGTRLTINRVHHLQVLDRLVVHARWQSESNLSPEQTIWLYAERDHLLRARWFAHSAVFDVDVLLSR